MVWRDEAEKDDLGRSYGRGNRAEAGRYLLLLGQASSPDFVEDSAWASSGELCLDEIVTIGADGRFVRTLAMRENDVWFVELTPH